MGAEECGLVRGSIEGDDDDDDDDDVEEEKGASISFGVVFFMSPARLPIQRRIRSQRDFWRFCRFSATSCPSPSWSWCSVRCDSTV